MRYDDTGIPRHWYLGISPQDQETAEKQQQSVQKPTRMHVDALGVEHELKLRHSSPVKTI
jgi:hypothetical protein